MPAILLAIALFALLSPVPAYAQDGQDLEEWQKKILKAIEASETDAPSSSDRRGYSKDKADDGGAARAAQSARKRYGGKVLAVVKSGGAYRVRLLGQDGRVSTVTIRE